MVRCKDGVDLYGLQYEMRLVLIEADRIWRKHGQELVITSTWENNTPHGANSYHWFGYAVDFRTNYFGNEQAKIVRDELRLVLPEMYDVVLEDDHMHIEFDVERARG